MAQIKRIVTIGGTLAVAIGVGFVMQTSAHSEVKTTTFQAPEKVNVDGSAALVLTNIVNTSALPVPPVDMQEIAILPPAPVIKVVAQDMPIMAPPVETPTPELACDVTLEAQTMAAAMVDLKLSAACLPNERITLHHNGMMFTEVTDENGALSLQVPALSQAAIFIVAFANGEGAVASATVPSLEFYDRVVVQWRGQSGLQLHAREYGAGYGENGHVWASAKREITFAARGQGGVLTRHGADDIEGAHIAEIYTFPSGTAQTDGDVLLSVEAEITAQNCGRDIEAQTLQISAENGIKVQELTLAIPNCDAVGDFLVLNNMLNDLTIARN